MITATLCAALTLAAPAHGANSADARMNELTRGTHAVAPALLKKLTPADKASLIALAKNPKVALYQRVRALGFLGVVRDAQVEGLWAEARRSPEREIRIQAALSQAMARRSTPEALSFVESLLADPEGHIREVGVNMLFVLRTPHSIDRAKAHLDLEKDEILRELLIRRLSELD